MTRPDYAKALRTGIIGHARREAPSPGMAQEARRALCDACYDACHALMVLTGKTEPITEFTWVELADAVLGEVEPETIDTLWRLGDLEAITKLVCERRDAMLRAKEPT